MDNDHGITDELRRYASYAATDRFRQSMLAIADRIDAALAERYIELPKDADGVPIRIGAELEFSAFEIEKPVTRMVDGIGQGVFFAWCGERGYQPHEAKRYRHHHEPTVEDLLREFFSRYVTTKPKDEDDAIIAEYAAKLRLAEEGE